MVTVRQPPVELGRTDERWVVMSDHLCAFGREGRCCPRRAGPWWMPDFGEADAGVEAESARRRA